MESCLINSRAMERRKAAGKSQELMRNIKAVAQRLTVKAVRGDAVFLGRRLAGGARLDVRGGDDPSWLSLGRSGSKTVHAGNQKLSQDPKY